MGKQEKLEKSLGRYRSRITASRKWREEEKYDETWKRLKSLYGLKHFEGMSDQDRIAVAISFSTINVIYPSISVNHPKTTVFARKPEDNDKAIITEAVLDWTWKTDNVGDEFRRAVKDFLIFGHGWVKTGYKFKEKTVDRPTDDIDAEFASAVQSAQDAGAENPELAGEMPTDDDIMAAIPTTTQVVTEDRAFVERISVHDMFVDPEATSLGNAKWVAQKIRRPIEEVHADERYDPKARKAVRSDLASKWQDDVKVSRLRGTEVDAQRVTVWEFYDLTAQTMAVFADQGEGFLVAPRPLPYRIGHPFVMVRNYDVPDEFYPIGDLEAIEPLQAELNRTRSQLMQAREQFARKLLIKGSAFDSEARAALQAPGDNFVIVNEGNDSLSDLIYPVPPNQIPGELFGYTDTISRDIDTVSGVSDYQRGASAEVRRTATEASMIQDAVNARSADKLGIIEKAVAEIGKNLMALAGQFMTGQQVARVIGKEGMPIWVPFTQEDIDVDADFDVEGGSTMPKNEAWRQNQAMQLLQAVGPMIGQVIDPTELAKYVLTSFGIKTPEKFMMQAPPMGGPPRMPGDPNAPQGAPGAPPGPGMEPPPPGDPSMSHVAMEAGIPEDPAMASTAGPGGSGLPPEIMAQLQGQVGLNLGES